jgi:hypothetical protein
MAPRMRRAYVAIGVLWLWALLLLLTHAAARSPYSYSWALVGREAIRVYGAVANPDAAGMIPAEHYFYDARPPAWRNAFSIRIPLHPFAVSLLMPFTRSTLLSNYLANLGALMLLAAVAIKACQRRGLPLLPSTIALMTLYALPWVVTYVGQPMYYVPATTINFLVVIAAFSLDDDDLRRPWLSGLLLAVVLLNYDPYIYALALGAWIVFVIRFRRVRDIAVFAAVALLPSIAWTQFVRRASSDTLSRLMEKTFIRPIVGGWMEFLRHPIDRAVQPYLAAHIGTRVGAQLILAEIYWPMLLLCAAAFWRLGDHIPRTRRTALMALLAAVYALHQFGTALFDWENNPRRALAVVLAAGFAYCWCAAELWPHRAWRIAFAAVLAVCAFATMADVLIKRPMLTFLSTGQAVQMDPRYGMQLRKAYLTKESLPTLLDDENVWWRDLPRVTLTKETAATFAVTQLFVLFFFCALLWLLARARLLPRFAAAAGALVWVAGLIRFL